MIKFIFAIVIAILILGFLGGQFGLYNVLTFLEPLGFVGEFIVGLTSLLGHVYGLVMANGFVRILALFFFAIIFLRYVIALVFNARTR